MGSRLALMATTAALGCALVLVAPAFSQVVIDGKKYGVEPQTGAEPEGAESQSQAAPKEAAPPPTPGCPYRERKLDLIV